MITSNSQAFCNICFKLQITPTLWIPKVDHYNQKFWACMQNESSGCSHPETEVPLII